MDSGRSGSKGKGHRAKDPASTNQNSAQNSNSKPACGPCGSGSHLVHSSGTGCSPKDSVSTIRSSAQNSNADGTASGPCGSSSFPVLGSQTERAPVGLPLQSAWASGRLKFSVKFSVGGHNIDVPTEGNSTSGAPPTGLGSQERESMEVQENPHGVRESKGISGGAIQGVEVGSGKSPEEPSGSVSSKPCHLSNQQKQRVGTRESMEVQENPHGVRESKGIAGVAIQGVEICSGKSPEEPSGSVSLKPSRLSNQQKQRVDGSNPVVMNKGLPTSSDYQGYGGNKEESFDISRGGRGGSRGGYGYQRGENDGRSGNEDGGWNRGRGGRGGRGRYGSQRGESDRIDALGRLLSSVLRHRAVDLKLNVRSDGYVPVKDLLKLTTKTQAGAPLHSYSVDDIGEAVKRDNKQRFGLLEEKSVLYIRANQGHSMKLIDSEGLLKPILSAEEVPVCVHGTYLKNLESIKKNGLNRMKRNHVHFARGLPADNGVISGMRGNCEVLIYLDAKKALQDGMKLFVSENGVILTEGFNGVVPPEYFANIQTVAHKRNKRY